MAKKGKVCRECGGPLTGIRSQYCSDTCYLYRKYAKAKSVSHLRRENFPEKNCYTCGKLFKPIRRDHRNCSKSCSKIDARSKQIFKRDSRVRLPTVKPYENYKIRIKNIEARIEKHSSPTFVKSQDPKHSELNAAVLDFLEKGGEIKKLPDEINGKTPSVNFTFGSEIDTSEGLGYELNSTQLLDEYDNYSYRSII
jgi:predicted nucleic acid-binding Zn ribbon protein